MLIAGVKKKKTFVMQTKATGAMNVHISDICLEMKHVFPPSP
jgi:hypothetical protein